MSASDSPAVLQAAPSLVALLQLARRARAADRVEALGFTMVNESRQLLRYRQSAFWIGGARGHLATVSGLPQLEPNAPYVQWLSQVCAELAEGSTTGQPHALQASDLSPLLAETWGDWLPAQAVWLPLQRQASLLGGLLFATEERWGEQELGLAAELGDSYAHALAALAPARPWSERVRQSLRPTRRRIGVGIFLLALALFPVRQSVLAPAEVVAQQPFLVRAPLDGVIDRVLVQPNQVVQAGTPLFEMDTTALRARQDVARKALDAAQEEFRQSAQAAVTDEKSKREVALRRGDLDEKAVELGYAADQLGRVQLKAERAGVAVFSDVNDWQGKAVSLGERIMLLADPKQVALSIELPAGESLDLQAGMRVQLYPNADPLSQFEARISQIAYSPELARDGVLAYRLKAEFVAGTPPPRIGLMGTAKLSAKRVPLIYHALRRPLTTLRQWLGF